MSSNSIIVEGAPLALHCSAASTIILDAGKLRQDWLIAVVCREFIWLLPTKADCCFKVILLSLLVIQILILLFPLFLLQWRCTFDQSSSCNDWRKKQWVLFHLFYTNWCSASTTTTSSSHNISQQDMTWCNCFVALLICMEINTEQIIHVMQRSGILRVFGCAREKNFGWLKKIDFINALLPGQKVACLC